MTVKDELLIFWIFCLALVSFFIRHFMGCAADLIQHVAAVSPIVVPSLLQFFTGHF